MTDPVESLTLHEAADRLDVHYMTVYRWVRLGMLPAHKTGGTWRVDPADLVGIRAHPADPTGEVARPPAPRARSARRAPWSERLRDRMLAGDASGSWAVVEAAMVSGVEPQDIYVDILTPALHGIGAGWASGTLPIEQEHMASSVAASIIGRMSGRFRRRGRHRGSVVLAMPSGERHGLGVAMLADMVAQGGYEVMNLGPDTPPESLAAAILSRDDVRAVVISVVGQANLPGAAKLVAASRKADAQVPIIAGGFAIPDARTATSIGADAWAADPRRLVSLIEDRTHA